MVDDINARAEAIKAQQAQAAAEKAAAEEAARQAQRQVEYEQLTVENLCRRFTSWANRNKIKPDSTVKGKPGWRLGKRVTINENDKPPSISTYYLVVTAKSEIFTIWEIEPISSTVPRRRDGPYRRKGAQGFMSDDVKEHIAEFVVISGIQWDG